MSLQNKQILSEVNDHEHIEKSCSEQQTRQWSEGFAKHLKSGDIIGLWGNLGAGKTVICKGIARGLGYTGQVTSPSYTLVNEYQGTIPLYHIDLYRLNENADWEEIGIDYYFNSKGICLIEWPERLDNSQTFTWNIKIKVTGELSREMIITR